MYKLHTIKVIRFIGPTGGVSHFRLMLISEGGTEIYNNIWSGNTDYINILGLLKCFTSIEPEIETIEYQKDEE